MGTFHDQLADAVKLRQKAINGVLRWQKKKHEAEALIEQLSNQRQAAEEGPVPISAEEEVALLDEQLKPVFGITDSDNE